MSFNRLPLTKKVGEVAEGEEKFQSWSGTHGYYTRPATVSNPFKTDKMLSGTFDKDEMINNVSLCTTLRELNKSQVEFKPKTGTDAKMLGTSSSMSYFVDQKLLSHIMQENGTEEKFHASFDKIYDSLPESGPERSKYYSIPVKRVRDVVNDCMGIESPEFIVNKFIELSNYHSAGGRISCILSAFFFFPSFCHFDLFFPPLFCLNCSQVEYHGSSSGVYTSTYYLFTFVLI